MQIFILKPFSSVHLQDLRDHIKFDHKKKLNSLCWFEPVQRVAENRIPKEVLYMNLEATRLRGRPRNRWQDEVREDGRLVGGKGWKERLYTREEWKKLLRTESNHYILHMPLE
jgi:hypothetical protein